MSNADRKGVIFLCTGNTCRSVMAEAMTNFFLAQKGLFAISAGVEPASNINPIAVKVLAEIGIDALKHTAGKPKTVESVQDTADLILAVTVCSHANESCPRFPKKGVSVVHRGFDDPPHLTKGMSEEDAIAVYRRVRDEIKAFVCDELVSLVPA